MTDTFASTSDAQLLDELTQEIDALRLLRSEDQRRLLAMARGLAGKGMSLPFVLAGVRASAEVLVDLEQDGSDSVLNRPEVRRFLEENATTADRVGPVFRGNDVKRMERERLTQRVVGAIREARRSRGRHEIKKTRSALMKIDQRELRRRLGREGDELCREINTILRSMAPMF